MAKLDKQEFIAQYKYHPHFVVVWTFVAGIVTKDINTLNLFFLCLMTGPHDCIGFVDTRLKLYCLNEAKLSNQCNAFKPLLDQLTYWIKLLINSFEGFSYLKIFKFCPYVIEISQVKDLLIQSQLIGKVKYSDIEWITVICSDSKIIEGHLITILNDKEANIYERISALRDLVRHFETVDDNKLKNFLVNVMNTNDSFEIRFEAAKNLIELKYIIQEVKLTLLSIFITKESSEYERSNMHEDALSFFIETGENNPQIISYLKLPSERKTIFEEKDIRMEIHTLECLIYFGQEIRKSTIQYCRLLEETESKYSTGYVSGMSHEAKKRIKNVAYCSC